MGEILTHRCPACDRLVEGAEIKVIKAGSTEMKSCAKCGSALVTDRSRTVQPIARSLAKATLYPLRPMTLAISAGVLVFGFGASFLPLGGVIRAGIQFGWLFAVLRSAAHGAEDAEIDASDVGGSVFSWIGPFVRYFFASLVAFGPAVIAALALGKDGYLVAAALALVGSLYLPSALIIAAHDTSWFAPLNPVPAVKLIARIPGPYATACALLFVLALVAGAITGAARSLDIPIVSSLLEAVLAFLPLVAAARMLGVLVWECREELD